MLDAMNHPSRRFAIAGTLLALLATGALAAADMTPSASVTTTVQGWEHWFRVEWTTQMMPTGEQIDGYIYNGDSRGALNVQVLGQGLDRAGNVVAQKIEWVPGGVPAFNRAYFRIAGLPPAERYRVTVWAFDWRKR
jgi:hypothetical protein